MDKELVTKTFKMAEELGALRGAVEFLFSHGGPGYKPIDLSGENASVSVKALEFVKEKLPDRSAAWITTSES